MKVLFFAKLREQLGTSALELDLADCTVAEVKAALIAEGGEPWREALEQDNLICAVNQRVADGNHPVAANDEVAFFPPVTGG